MAMKPPRGRKPIRVESKPDPRYKLLRVYINGNRVLEKTRTLAEVNRGLDLWPVEAVRAEILFRDENDVDRHYYRHTGKGRRMTAYVSGMKDIHPDPTNQATKPSWRRRPTEKLIPHTKNDHDHQTYAPPNAPKTTPLKPPREEKPIKNLPRFTQFD
jgi:hypothetical protein